MKKLIVSMMLIAMFVAFAAESAPSSTVGYVKYANLKNATGTSFNRIALAVNNPAWTASNLINPTGTMFRSISQWNATTQAWQTSSWVAGSTWGTPFAVSVNRAYQIGAYTTHDLIVSGSLVDNAGYSFVKSATTGYNLFMVPLHKSTLTTTTLLGNNMGLPCIALSRWNNATQTSSTSSRVGTTQTWGSTFATEVAQPLMANVNASFSWGAYGTKDNDPSEEYGEYDSSKGDVPKGTPEQIYVGVVDHTGVAYDFPTDFGPGKVTVRTWIKARPAEIQTEISPSVEGTNFSATLSCVVWDIGNFATQWAGTDSCYFEIKDERFFSTTGQYYSVIGTVKVDETGAAVMIGMDELLMDGSLPFQMSAHPSSIEGNVPVSTKLHQNYPNPFNPTTSIRFDLAKESVVKLSVYNYNGQLVKSLVDGQMNAGVHTVNFDASSLSAGVYYYTMEAGNSVMSNKMILVK